MTVVTDFVVPPMGEPIDSARLVRWAVMPGQAFHAGDILVEIETDKSIVEVPAPQDGVLVEHLVGVDGRLNADTPIARIQVEGEAATELAPERAGGADVSSDPSARKEHEVDRTGGQAAHAVAVGAPRAVGTSGERRFATPAARKLASERRLSIDTIAGSGPGGRVTRSDVAQAALPASAGSGAFPAEGKGVHESIVQTTQGEVGVTLWEPASGRSVRTLVLVHGMFGDRNVWAGTADVLARAGLRTLAMDLPCHGSTRSEATAFGEVVDCVAQVVAKRCSGNVVLVGHSYGGAVAARIARQPTLSVDALILIAPVGLGSRIEQTFLDGMTYAESNDAMLRELRKLTVAGMTPTNTYVNALRVAIAARRTQFIDFCRRVSWNGVQQIDILPDLAASARKTVLIQGRRDQIVPWEQVLNVPARVALHLLADAGHMPQWEATTATTDIILDSLAR